MMVMAEEVAVVGDSATGVLFTGKCPGILGSSDGYSGAIRRTIKPTDQVSPNVANKPRQQANGHVALAKCLPSTHGRQLEPTRNRRTQIIITIRCGLRRESCPTHKRQAHRLVRSQKSPRVGIQRRYELEPDASPR